MKRLHIIVILTLLFWVSAWWLSSMVLFGVATLIFLIVISLGVVFPRMRLFGEFICRGKSSLRRVALTFDDGPDERSTPALLELLREAHIQAAFFGIGKRVAAHPELAARIVREGHLLENHSHAHSNLTNLFSVKKLREDFFLASWEIENATKTTPRFFRPPMGLSNPRIFKAASALSLKVIGWTARGLDTKLTDPKKIVARIERRLKPGAIILLHDGNIPAERLLATVKLLLEKLRALEYEIVRLDRILT
jgi:peptidoglycan-N-acetylglucosamine deacetylase